MFRFEHPLFLFGLGLLPLLGLFHYFVSKKKKKALNRLGNASLLLPEMEAYNRLNKKKVAFFSLALIFTFISLANPQMGTKSEIVKTNGFDVFLALDISRSMLVTDTPPSRLDRLKRMSEEFIRSLSGNRIGIIVFAGNAYLQTPLTTDYRGLLLFLQSLSPEMVSHQGTNFSSAISVALRYFSFDKATGKALIILSDGENHEPGLEDAARQAAQKGISIFTIGIGTDAGAKIPDYSTGVNVFKTNENGEPIISKLEPENLQTIARITRGNYYTLDMDPSVTLKRILSDLNRLEKTSSETRVYAEYRSYYQLFLMVACFFLLLEFFQSFKKIRLTLLLTLFYVSLYSQNNHKELRTGDRYYRQKETVAAEEAYRKALEKNASPKAWYNLGNAVYNQGRFEESANNYQQSLNKMLPPDQKANAYYNLGNALYQKGNFKGSIDAYKQALRIKPGDPESQHNLTVALKKQQQQQNQQQQQKQQQQQNKQDQQQQQQQQQQQNKNQQEQPDKAQRKLSKEEAETLLNIMDEEEKKVQSKLRQAGKSTVQAKKDW
jgi:Ca-activated chloride channel family protein